MTTNELNESLDPTIEALTDATALACNRGYGRLHALADIIGNTTMDAMAGLQAWALARHDLDTAWAVETARWARLTPHIADPPHAWAHRLRVAAASRAAAEWEKANADPEVVRDINAALRDARLISRSDAPGPRRWTDDAEHTDESAHVRNGDEEAQLRWEDIFTEAAQQRLATMPHTAALCLEACASLDAIRFRTDAMDSGEAQTALCADTLGRWRHAEAARRQLVAQLERDLLSVARVARDLRDHPVGVLASRYAEGAHLVEAFTLEVAVRHAAGIPASRPHALLAMTEPAFAATYRTPPAQWGAKTDVVTLMEARLAVVTSSADVLRMALMRYPGARRSHARTETLWELAAAYAAQQPAYPQLEVWPLDNPNTYEVPTLLLARVRRALASFER